MEKGIDINEIIAKVVQNEIDGIFDVIKTSVSKTIKEVKLSFRKYLVNSYTRVNRTKTLLYKDSPVFLNEIYVDLDLSYNKQLYKLDYFINDLSVENKYLLTATAGAGKSIIAKKLFLSVIEKSNLGIPVFFELRDLNNSERTIIQGVIDLFESYGLQITEELFFKLLKKSKFLLILDGYDEVELSIKERVSKEIKYLVNKFANIPIFITTRPDEKIESLTELYVVRVNPLTKDQAINLIQKLNYDTGIKRKFIKQLQEKLYDKHSDFLSNPLLLTIMLMTYGQIAEIPEKMHIFYEQAFDALFFKHDALKSMYKRDLHTKLPIDDFKRILAIISINTYLQNQVNFSNSKIIDQIRKAKKNVGLKFNVEDYKHDLLESVCILINDGTSYVFTHRSFQEYFAAYFVSFFNITKKRELLRKLLRKAHTDNVLALSFEMNSSNVEKNLIIPVGKELVQFYSETKNEIEILKICFNKLNAKYNPHNKTHSYYVVNETEYWYFLKFFLDIYSKKYKSLVPKLKHTLTKKAFIETFGRGKVEHVINVNLSNIEEIRKLGIIEYQIKNFKFVIAVLEKVIERNEELDLSIDSFL